MRGTFKSSARAILAGLAGIAALAFTDIRPVAAQGPAPNFPWADPELARAARAEAGSVTVYSSVNEQEALPFWKLFEDATGIKVEYVRASDVVLIARIAIEQRARQRSWDLLLSPAVGRLPRDFMQQIDASEAKNLMPQARDPDRRWYGVYANYDVPSYNSKLVNSSDLPGSYEGFLDHKEWAGRIAIEQTDMQWLSALFTHYGEERGRKLVGESFILDETVFECRFNGLFVQAHSVAVSPFEARNLSRYQRVLVGEGRWIVFRPLAQLFKVRRQEAAPPRLLVGGSVLIERRHRQRGVVEIVEQHDLAECGPQQRLCFAGCCESVGVVP